MSAAAPVSSAALDTPLILDATSVEPADASWTLRAISWVAAPCSTTADAMVVEISLMVLIVAAISAIASYDWLVEV